MAVGLQRGHEWEGEVIPPPPIVQPSHAPHDWRAVVNPRLRRLLLQGILPDDFLLMDMREIEELMQIIDDLDSVNN